MQAAGGSTGAGAGIAASASAATTTVVMFVLIGLLAVLTVIGILWGMRLKRRRLAAEKELEERAEEIENAVPTEPDRRARIAPTPTPPPPPPVSSAPLARTPARADEPAVPDAPARERPVDEPSTSSTGPTLIGSHTARIAAEPPCADTGPFPADGPVTQLKGLGPKVATQLATLGITTVGQIAALDHDQAQALDARLGAFTGRMGRDRWIEQARFLAAGDVKGFEAVFGRL